MGQTRDKKPSKRSLKTHKANEAVSAPVSQLENLVIPEATIISSQPSPISATPSTTTYLSISGPSTKTSCSSLGTRPSINSISSTPSSSSLPLVQTYDSSLVEVRNTSDRGYALFTTRRVPAGRLILAEAPMIRLTAAEESSSTVSTEDALDHCFKALPKSSQKAYMKLHDSEKTSFSRIKSIYFSNCYDLGKPDTGSAHGGSAIGLLASRINHSCIPNVQFSFADTVPPQLAALVASDDDKFNGSARGVMLFYTLRNLSANRELLSNYDSIFATAAQRQVKHQMYYGFRCDCEACTGESEFWAKSDERRRELAWLKGQIDAADKRWRNKQRTCDEHDGDITNKKSRDEMHYLHSKNKADALGSDRSPALTSSNEILSSIRPMLEKLEGLLIKEGLFGVDLANAYRDLAIWSARAGNSATAKAWATKEQKTCIIAFGGESRRVTEVAERITDG